MERNAGPWRVRRRDSSALLTRVHFPRFGRPDPSGYTIVATGYLLLIGLPLIVLPAGPVNSSDSLTWLRGATAVGAALAIAALGTSSRGARSTPAYALVALPQMWFGLDFVFRGYGAAGWALLIVSVGIVLIPFARNRPPRATGRTEVHSPLLSAVVLGATAASWGLSMLIEHDASYVIIRDAGLNPTLYATALAATGSVSGH